jgi:MoaA/NifB/PqqE/SkfB family radical SAM enzyme
MTGTRRLRDLVSGVKVLLGILSRRRVFIGPRSVGLTISNICDTNCLMCGAHSTLLKKPPVPGTMPTAAFASRQPFMDDRLLKQCLQECHDTGTFRLVLGGNGEPALHPSFDEVLVLMRRLRMEPYVLTNGLSLDRGRVKIWGATPGHFRFSLHAGDPETWHRVHPRNKPEQFERLSRHIKELAAAGVPKVSTMHVIQKANFRQVCRMVEHAREVGVKEILFRPARDDGGFAGVVPGAHEEQELHRELSQAHRLAESYGIHTNLGEYLATNLYNHQGVLNTWPLYEKIPCYVGYLHAEIDLDGTLIPCIFSRRVMGKMGVDGLWDLWNSPPYRAYRLEGRAMPRRGTPVKGCLCGACCMVKFNQNLYRLLHLKSLRYGDA